MRPLFGTRGLPPEVHASWRLALSDRQGVPARILAWARSQDGFAVGSPAVLSLGGETQGWHHLGWHEIEHGGWNAESRSLSWTLYGGRRGRVELAEPARLPELFRERVAASIAVERFVPIRGERGVTVTARRDLGAAGTLSWHSTLTRGLSGNGAGVAEEIARAEAELQSEYGTTPQGW
ncbi:MAG: hypothetical protein ACRYG2_36200 [Janthinobacterium lividum]